MARLLQHIYTNKNNNSFQHWLHSDSNAGSGHDARYPLLFRSFWQDCPPWTTRVVESVWFSDHVTLLLSRRRPRVHWSVLDILPAYRRDCSSSGLSRDRKCSHTTADGPHL